MTALIRYVIRGSARSDLEPLFPRYLIRTPYNGELASQTRYDYCPQSPMIEGGCYRVWWGAGNR